MLYRVCSSNDLTDNSMIVFKINKDDILVGRRSGRLFSCNNSCPHRGASLSKGDFNGDNIVCYMHGYEYNVFTGKLEHMKSWKKDKSWMEQSFEWRKSDDLTLYPIMEKDGTIYVELR
ncbi:MAG TPA: Rieske 2Fe-2S domain-containing protein [Nitrososphaeraceae archaeon]